MMAMATEVHKWEVTDLQFSAKVPQGINPFTVDFSAAFTGPSGQVMEIPGFYNGDKEWTVRFSASEAGEWEYSTSSEITSLDGKKGTVVVSEKVTTGSHGAVVIPVDNPQHFAYEDGTPYFLMAYECDWLYALDYHNKVAIPKTEHFLDLLARNGCTQVVLNVFSYDVSWPKDEKLNLHPEHEFGGPEEIFPFLGNNSDPDYSALNVEFFKRFDRTVAALNDRGIVAHLMIYVWNKLVNWPGMYTEADNMYFDYVVKRYQAFQNVVWDISKEALTYGRADDEYILERISRLRSLNVYNRLVTVHDYGFCNRHPESVDFISMQTWTNTLYTFTLNTVRKYSDKPVFNIEHGGYEKSPYVVWTGDYNDPEICLRRNYMCLFGGGYSTYYWQGCSWNVIIYNPFEQPDDFIRPRFDYYRHLSALFTEHPYSELKPDPGMNASAYCLSDGKGKFLFYVPKENYQLQANYFRDKLEGRTFRWYNTLTGEYAPVVPVGKGPEGAEVLSAWQNDIHLRSPWQGEADAVLITEQIPR